MSPRIAALAAVGLGIVAVVAATAFGSSSSAIDVFISPPAVIRAGLVGGSAALCVFLLSRGLVRLAAGSTDVPSLVRGVRLVFLALAAASAGIGWLLADPLPLIVALVIAGIDVIETSFLLVVVAGGRADRPR
ncbi:MAG: hypothetical protein ABJC39_01295 [Chloroflexota bacterium]